MSIETETVYVFQSPLSEALKVSINQIAWNWKTHFLPLNLRGKGGGRGGGLRPSLNRSRGECPTSLFFSFSLCLSFLSLSLFFLSFSLFSRSLSIFSLFLYHFFAYRGFSGHTLRVRERCIWRHKNPPWPHGNSERSLRPEKVISGTPAGSPHPECWVPLVVFDDH